MQEHTVIDLFDRITFVHMRQINIEKSDKGNIEKIYFFEFMCLNLIVRLSFSLYKNFNRFPRCVPNFSSLDLILTEIFIVKGIT